MTEALINYLHASKLVPKKGSVYLIGAGPGDIELLTLKAIRIICQADVILTDSLVNPAVLQFARPEAKVIHVGKRFGRASVPQQHINSQLIALARRGLCVVRLKGGDPCIFARGGEEMLAIAQAGIELTIVSGISSGVAITAALGIPLTHRDLVQSLVFVVGSTRDGGAEPDWSAIAKSGSTILVYMGLTQARDLTAKLIAAGLPSDTPAAAVQDCTLPSQKAILSELSGLANSIVASALQSPTMLIVGKVVSLSPLWCQKRQLTATGVNHD